MLMLILRGCFALCIVRIKIKGKKTPPWFAVLAVFTPPARRAHSPGPVSPIQLFLSFFKTLVGKEVTVELKNDLT